MPDETPYSCPLCSAPDSRLFHEDRQRTYRQCEHCELVFVPQKYHLSAREEKARYDLHENDADDGGYRRFLTRMVAAIVPQIKTDSYGLDFGSGPGPVLAEMLKEAGFKMRLYDPYYAYDPAALKERYDFIVTTETVEHLSRPGMELERLWSCLKPGGVLGIMTKRVLNLDKFKDWHYIRDDTHICFFSERSFQHLAERWSAELCLITDDIALFIKPK